MILKNLDRKDRIGSSNKCATGGCPYGKIIDGICDICYAKKIKDEKAQEKHECLSRYEHKKKKGKERRNGRA